MASPYEKDAFASRVNLAASYIAAGRQTSRTFDTCFEMWDGDAVAVAVYRRARSNPRLRANLWRYLTRSHLLPLAFRNRRKSRADLAAWAAELRTEAERRSAMDRSNHEAELVIQRGGAVAAGYRVESEPRSNAYGTWNAFRFVRPDGTKGERERSVESDLWHAAFIEAIGGTATKRCGPEKRWIEYYRQRDLEGTVDPVPLVTSRGVYLTALPYPPAVTSKARAEIAP